MALESVIQTQLVVGGIKLVSNRERPNKGLGEGRFFSGGRSFPSGHAATSFAFATVVADQYKDKPWVAVGAYGMATAISLSRVGGLNHFPSDVLIGGGIGYLIGKFVLHRHRDRE
jgi:membrane-associated phospholipid phosphatase